jgi:membrane protease YdiL (CAAX protease family)
LKRLFVGPSGIRAGWRLLIFVALIAAQAVAVAIAGHILSHRSAAPHVHDSNTVFWVKTAINEVLVFAIVLLATFAMSKIERRGMGAYGLPWRGAFAGRFWKGALAGFGAISAVLAVIFALHGFSIAGIAPLAPPLLIAFAGYTIAFAFVGLTEEYLFRGYAQRTLAQGIGFWPAAVVLSAVFAAMHLENSGESAAGVTEVFLFGIVFCFVLLRTGNLWFAVGFHFAWDWAETFVYGVPDSGVPAGVSVLHGVLTGPVWMSGGSAGPEASIFTPIVLVAVAALVARLYPAPAGVRVFQAPSPNTGQPTSSV